MCTHIAIIERGRLLASGDVQDILRSLQPHRSLELRVLGAAERAEELLRGFQGVLSVQREAPASGAAAGDGLDAGEAAGELAPEAEGQEPADARTEQLLIDFAGDERGMAELLAHLVAGGVPVTRFAEQAGDLEDIFLHVTKGIV
jgi:ABC-2 type transport system ATP-binding protein